jgi:hypothetical protein
MSNASRGNSSSSANARATDGRRPPKPPTVGPGDKLGEGDSSLVLDVLPQDLADVAFENMRKEVAWHTMYHQGTGVNLLI